MQLRINHEATGNWFAYKARATYQQVADFYIHAREVIIIRTRTMARLHSSSSVLWYVRYTG